MNKEETMLRKRLAELSRTAYDRGIVTFSDFLDLNELNILHTTPKDEFPARYETNGGYEMSERQMVAFLPDALYYEYQYPFLVIEINPLNLKFAEKLTHRDYLGAMMNLGIERSKLGDIIVGDNKAYVFVKDEMAGYLAGHLTSVRHTCVKAAAADAGDVVYAPEYEEITGTVPSVRLDAVLAAACRLSRSKTAAYIESGRVYVNGRAVLGNGHHLEEGDVISVRQVGKFRYQGILSETKKGRYLIAVRRYI